MPTYERKLTLQLRCLLPDKTYWLIRPSSSVIPSFYSLPKIHKPTIPLHPIVSCVGSVCYNLATFLVPILRPLFGASEHHIFNSTNFIESIKNMRLSRNEVMVSFDIESLFTTREVIELLDKLLKEDRSLHNRTPIPPEEIS